MAEFRKAHVPGQGFQDSMISGPGITGAEGLGKTGQTFGFQDAVSADTTGFHFGFRLARMMVPKLSLAGLKVESKTGTVYPTHVERKVKTVISQAGSMTSKTMEYDDVSKGIQFVNKEAVLNYVEKDGAQIMRGGVKDYYSKNKDKVETHVQNIKTAYADAYKIQGDNILGPGLPLTVDDFVSPKEFVKEYNASVPYHKLGVETDNIRNMQEIINVIKNANDNKGLPLKNNPILYADKVYALQKDAHEILQAQVASDNLSQSIKSFKGNGDADADHLKDLIAVARLTGLPPSKTGIANVYQGVKPLATNLDNSGRSQGKVQRVLKQMSVEIVKTLVNEVKKKDTSSVLPLGDKIEAIGNDGRRIEIAEGKPAYKINAEDVTKAVAKESGKPALTHDKVSTPVGAPNGQATKVESGNELRFFMRHLSEPRLRTDSKSYRYIIFEYENLMNKDDNANYKATNTFNRIASMNASFLVSSLNAMRHYVVVIVAHDALRRQQYYSKYCMKNTDVRDFVQMFDQAWSSNSLRSVQDFLFDTVMPSEGFRGVVKDVYDQVFRVLPSVEFNPFTEDLFSSIYRTPQAHVRDEALMNGQVENLKHGLERALTLDKKGAVVFDIEKANLKDLQNFLRNLPRLKSSDTDRHVSPGGSTNLPFHKSGLWWDSGSKALREIDQHAANLLSVPQVDKSKTTIKNRLSHIEVDIDTKNIVPIMNPVVLQAMLFLKHLINDIEYATLRSAGNKEKRRVINEAMEDIFRSKGNLFIAWRFGNILSNCLTRENLPMVGTGGDGARKIVAYRAAAQALLNATVFAHSMGRFESVYIFTRDVMLKLYTMAEVDARSNIAPASGDNSTAARILQALYTATVVSRASGGQAVGNTDFGLTLPKAADFFNKSRRNIRLLIKDNEIADPVEIKDADGVAISAETAVSDTETVNDNDVPFLHLDNGSKTLEQLRNMVVTSFHYWAMALLDDDYLRCNLIGLASGPHGGQLEQMENSIRNYLGTTRDLYRKQITDQGNYIIPNLISGDDPSVRETLDDRLDRQLPDGARVKGDLLTFPERTDIRDIRVAGDTLTVFDERTQNQLLQGVKNYEEGIVRAL